MELGLTFPLQRFLGIKTPAWGTEPDRRFCWDLHVIRLRGRGCLLAVHCHSRYAFVRWDVPPLQREDIPGLFRAGLTDSLTAAGLSPGPGWTGVSLEKAGAQGPGPACHPSPATHWARPGGGWPSLNRGVGGRAGADLCLDTERQAQPLLDRAVNTCSSRCAGFEGLGTGLERISASLL